MRRNRCSLKRVGGSNWAQRLRIRLRAAAATGRFGGCGGRSMGCLGRDAAAQAGHRRHGLAAGWVDELRRDLAVRMLADGRRSIEQVALSLGYGDARFAAPGLSQVDRRRAGRLPQQLRGDSHPQGRAQGLDEARATRLGPPVPQPRGGRRAGRR